jgi:hypothetical protein
MPQICATLNAELINDIQQQIPKFGTFSGTVEILLNEAIEYRKNPPEKDIVAFGEYLLSEERKDNLRSKFVNFKEERSTEIFKNVYQIDIDHFNEKVKDQVA